MSRATRHVFVTGTDTGVGKTVFTGCYVAWLRRQGIRVAAFKPLASGGREDAAFVASALGPGADLDVVNPWHFPDPLAPLLAARRAGRVVTKADLVGHVRRASRGAAVAVVEGAGGLLSPLLEGADAPDVIRALRSVPVIVAPDRLGVVGQVRLVWAALPPSARRQARVILMQQRVQDGSVATNSKLLGEYLGARRIHLFPRLTVPELRWFGAGVVDRLFEQVHSG